MSADRAYKYDVAISFLTPDLGVAQDIRDELAPHVSVFLFTDRQQEIAGTDGLETFRAAFLNDSRINVVLFRSDWGETPWTRIEKQAIEGRFLRDGPNSLFFIMLDSTSIPPRWLPEHLLRFNFKDYGVNQAVGAIKLRLQELGASFHEESLIQRAARSAELSKFNQETRRLWRCEEGVLQATLAASGLIDIIEKFAKETIEAVPQLGIKFGRSDTGIVIKTSRPSVSIVWENYIINVLEDACLTIRVFRSSLILPGEQLRYISGPPNPCAEYRFVPERVRGMGWCWKSTEDNTVKTSDEFAKYALELLLKEVEAQE